MPRKVKPALDQIQTASAKTLVSVIIPAYNAAPYIKETLDSVFEQTYRDFEVIVVNDGSPDTVALEEVLAPYRSRIIYVTQENRGLSGARNTGLRNATGNLVALLDADDIWMPTYLEEQVQFLNDHPQFDLVYCNARFFGDSVHHGKEYMAICPSEGDATAAAVISHRCHVFVSVTARTSVLASLQFDESLRSCEDYDCWIRLTAAGHRIGYHYKVLVRYRKHDASLSANPTWMTESNIKVLNKSLALWPPDSEEGRELRIALSERTAELEVLRSKLALREERIHDALRHLQAANGHYKSAKLSLLISLLRLMPGPVSALFHLRGSIFKAHRHK